MKRFIAVFLTLVMVFALFPAGSQLVMAEAERKPFVVLNMSDSEEEFENVYWLPFFWAYPITAETEWPRVHCYGVTFEAELAEALKEDFDARPAGARQFQHCLLQTGFAARVENVVYFDKAVEIVREWTEDFLKEYWSIGGKLDGIVVDLEYIESHSWYLYDYYAGSRGKVQNKNIYADIVNDPRYATQIRPRLEEMGFKFYENPSGVKSEIWCVNARVSEAGHENCKNIWNHLMDVMEREAINEAVLEPLLKYYPNAVLSDYQSGTYNTWEKPLDAHGNQRPYNLVGAGNVANFNAYCGRPESGYFTSGTQSYNNPPSYNHAVYEATPFSVTLFDANLFKTMAASTADGRINAWIGNYTYNMMLDSGYKSSYSGTPYYSEIIYHVGMLDPEPFLGFAISSKIERDGYVLEDELQTMSDIMVELTRVAGYADRKPIPTPATWNGSYILSGMYAGGRNIWRLTPDTSVVSVKDFKVKDNDPTFSIDGLTITFPQGKIIEDGNISQAGSCGYWIETPANVNPVITGSANRYQEHPSYLENFDGYTAGSSFTSSVALPKSCWEVSGTAQITANGSGNALALTGSTTVKNTRLPANITAGDDYAKQQAWEVTVTLSEGLKPGAIVKLLACNDRDGGFKISGGKVYYDQGGKYQQLSDVTLPAGTYTLRREVDFTNPGGYTSDYAVYDASGKLLGEVKDVAMLSVSLPVSAITMSCTGATGANGAVLLDDYKLYPTGVATVLDLYETKYGKELTQTDVARTEDTAYRLSWMNASDTAKVAYVYDTATGNVYEKVEMTPGMDGVVTGVVKVSAGKSVTLAVKTDNSSSGNGGGNDGVQTPTEPTPTEPSTEPGGNADSTEPTGTDGTASSDTGNTAPSDTQGTTPSGDTKSDEEKGISVVVIVVLVLLGIAIAGGGFAVYWWIVRPNLAARPAGDQKAEPVQTPATDETQIAEPVSEQQTDTEMKTEE